MVRLPDSKCDRLNVHSTIAHVSRSYFVAIDRFSGLGEGDCDGDNECDGNLKCGNRNKNGAAPYGLKFRSTNSPERKGEGDYCYLPQGETMYAKTVQQRANRIKDKFETLRDKVKEQNEKKKEIDQFMKEACEKLSDRLGDLVDGVDGLVDEIEDLVDRYSSFCGVLDLGITASATAIDWGLKAAIGPQLMALKEVPPCPLYRQYFGTSVTAGMQPVNLFTFFALKALYMYFHSRILIPVHSSAIFWQADGRDQAHQPWLGRNPGAL